MMRKKSKTTPQPHGGVIVRMQFEALETFEHEDKNIAKTVYVQGGVYQVRPGNKHLEELARVWEMQGKVRFISDANRRQAVTATSSGKMETR